MPHWHGCLPDPDPGDPPDLPHWHGSLPVHSLVPSLQSGGLAQFVLDGEAIGKKAGLLKRCALAEACGGCLARPRLLPRSCLIKAAPNVMPPRLFPNEPTHVLFEVLKLEPGASLDLNADVLGGGGSGGSTGSGSDAGSGSSGSTLLYATSLSLDSAVRVPGEAFAVLHAMAVVGGLLSGDSALHRGPDGTRHAQQPDTRQVWYSSLGHFLS